MLAAIPHARSAIRNLGNLGTNDSSLRILLNVAILLRAKPQIFFVASNPESIAACLSGIWTTATDQLAGVAKENRGQ
jgi:hypothetical protein